MIKKNVIEIYQSIKHFIFNLGKKTHPPGALMMFQDIWNRLDFANIQKHLLNFVERKFLPNFIQPI